MRIFYVDLSDEDDCLQSVCENGGECIDGDMTYTCNCPLGYTGDLCQTSKSMNDTCKASYTV